MSKLFKLFIILSIGLLCIWGCETDQTKVIVTAHRGASGLAPENTMSAMLKAVEFGSDFSELDVQETMDGIVVLLHDDSLSRTANIDKAIWEMDYASLAGIDVGSWYGATFKDEPIPSLEEVIDAVKGKMKLNIELKMSGHENMLEERVLEIVEKKGFGDECIVTSFKFAAIDKVKKLNPEIKAGYIFSKMPADIDVFTANVDLLSVKYKLVDKEFVDKAFANNKEVHVWTVNKQDEMKRLIALGVTSIITNRPDILIEILKE